MPTPDPPDQRAHSDAMDVDQPRKRDADDMDIDKPKKRGADAMDVDKPKKRGADAMDVDQPRTRHADSLFVHEEAENEDGHGSKRQKQDVDGLHASRPRDGTPSQGHDDISGTQPQGDRSSQALATLPYTIVDGKVPGLRQWKLSQRPPIAIFRPSFKQAQKWLIEACAVYFQVCDGQEANGYVNDEVKRINEQKVTKYRSPESRYPAIKPVLLLGAAGAGKSSGLNCYLDKTAAAVESDSGARGTNTVHEYSAACQGQTSEYRVVARYLQQRQIKDEIGRQCHAIYQYRNPTDDDHDEDEKDDLKEQHDTAIDFFDTLLGDREEYHNEDSERDFFDRCSGDDEADIIDELWGFVEELLQSKGILDNGMALELDAQDEHELNRAFHELSGSAFLSSKTGKPLSTWPLIVKVEVHFDNDILDCGLTIADAPGITDTNQIVVRKTKNYARGAGVILVTATPDRIKDNPNVDEGLKLCIQYGKMHETYLLVTKIDNKSPLKPTEISALRDDEMIRFQAAEDRLQSLKSKLARLNHATDSLDDVKELRTNMAQMKETEVEIAIAEMKVQQVAVELRNAKIQSMMRNKFRELTGSRRAPDLRVIFTSNREYQKHLAGYDRKNPPMLDLQATGIPEVQELLYNVLASGKVNTLRKIINTHLPSALSGVIGVLTHSRLERKSEVSNLIATVFEENTKIVTLLMNELAQKVHERIQNTMATNIPKWKQAAEAKLHTWERYKPATFGAFCRRMGVWKANKNAALSNWNYEIQAIYAAQVNSAFNILDEDINEVVSGAHFSINELYQGLEKQLEACEAFQGHDDTLFYDQIRMISKSTIESVAKECEKVRAQIDDIRHTVTLASDHTCVIGIMQETYKECMLQGLTSTIAPISYTDKRGKVKKKSGAHAARVEEVRKRLVGDGGVTGVFEAVSQLMDKSFRGALGGLETTLTKKLAKGSEDVLHEFDNCFQADDVKKEENSEAAEIIKNSAQRTLDIIRGPVKDLFDEAVAYETANAASA